MRFGLIIRGQYPQGDDMRVRLQEDLDAAKFAEELGYDLVGKGSHYSSHPFQYIQQIPYLCQVALIAPKLRLCPGVVLLPLHSPLHVAEELASLDVMCERQADVRRRHRLSRGGVQGVRIDTETVWQAVRGMSGGGEAAVVGRLRDHERRVTSNSTRQLHRDAGAESRCRRSGSAPMPTSGSAAPRAWPTRGSSTRTTRSIRSRSRWRSTNARWTTAGKPFPDELPMAREVFVAPTRAEAIRLARPSLEAKYKAYQRLGPGQGHARRRRIQTPISRS